VQRESWSLDQSARVVEGNSPRHQLQMQSYFDLPKRFSVFTAARYVDDLPSQRISAYLTVDASLLWQPRDDVEVSLTGRDLLDGRHSEFGPTRVDALERTIHGLINWRF
jgi:iron complex outermembrane receptor protein